MKLGVITTNVSLSNLPSYTTEVTVDNTVLILKFMWNDRLRKRSLSITNTNGDCYLQNTLLYPNEALTLNSNAIRNNFPYKVRLFSSKKVFDMLNWETTCSLCFYYSEELEA